MESKDDLARRIGNRLRELRKEGELTLKRLADATDLSPALLSRIENGLAMPSVQTLQVIANILKVEIGYFFKDEEQKLFVISAQGKRKSVTSGRGYEVVELIGERMGNAFMEPAIVTAKGKQQEDEVALAVHDGQEFMYVLEGRIEVTLGTKKFTLKKGDAAYWHGAVPHKGISLSKKPAKTLNVHLIPGKRVGTFERTE